MGGQANHLSLLGFSPCQMSRSLIETLPSPGWAAVIVASCIAVRYLAAPQRRYPPGPRPLPLVGNIRDVPFEHQEKAFAKWGEKYGCPKLTSSLGQTHRTAGSIVYANVLGRSMVILNSSQCARDLLDKRSSVYSDRPRFVLLGEL